MKQAIQELIEISHATGNDHTLVQGGGGNTSVKTPDGQTMFIKASGTALKDMNATQGWRGLEIERVGAILADDFLAGLDSATRETEVVNRLMLACNDGQTSGARPSVESILHAMLDKVVIHLHPLAVGAYVNAKQGRARLEKLWAQEKYPLLWVPYVDPGYSLARKVAQLVEQYQRDHDRLPEVIFLEKHGLLVSAATPEAGLRLTRQVIKRCSDPLRPLTARLPKLDMDAVAAIQMALRKACFDAAGQRLIVKHYMNETIAAFMRHKDGQRLLSAAALTPDELVYAAGAPVWLSRCDAATVTRKLRTLQQRGEKLPAAFVVENVGLFVAGPERTAPITADIATVSLAVRMHAARMGGVNALNKRQRDFICNWEAESFRQKVAGGGAAGGALRNQIAVVTGAGSGLGRSIAVGLARAGAIVALADIDENAAQETQQIIHDELPQATTMVAACNVTDENSVDDAFVALIQRWGGLDIVVNAAGVAPAYALVDLPVDKWRFALEVNLTGYFLMARAAARLMIAQETGGSIINISSKSGLEASKNNTPYNATKAGELHMARGWAMELGEHGIRVNCVCPGNVFEGSKIWNPEYIKTCAKKYGIKPEEVIPHYVNKTILRREIKGQDIADSVVFLCSDQARTITGQVIVADAGQVMVR